MSGVYCVWHDQHCLYVGSSKNIRQRFSSHTRKKEFALNGATHIEVFAHPEEVLGAEETAAIYRYQPTLNGIVGRPKLNKDNATVFVRYALTQDEISRLKKFQEYLERKFNLTKVSQTDALRHLLEAAEHCIINNIDFHAA